MTRLPTAAWAAGGGRDWADATPAGCRHAAGSEPRACSALAHPPAPTDAWVHPWRTRVKGHPVATCRARTRAPLGSARRKDNFLGRLPVPPRTRAGARDACAPSPARDDPPAAELPRARRRTPRDRRTPLRPPRPARRALAQRADHRRRLVGAHVRLPQRRTRPLKPDVPHVLPWVHATAPTISCDGLAQGPPLTAAHLARRSPLERCSCPQHGRDADVRGHRLHASKRATPLPTAAGLLSPTALLGQALSTQLRVTVPAIAAVDHAMAPRAQRQPAGALVDG